MSLTWISNNCFLSSYILSHVVLSQGEWQSKTLYLYHFANDSKYLNSHLHQLWIHEFICNFQGKGKYPELKDFENRLIYKYVNQIRLTKSYCLLVKSNLAKCKWHNRLISFVVAIPQLYYRVSQRILLYNQCHYR